MTLYRVVVKETRTYYIEAENGDRARYAVKTRNYKGLHESKVNSWDIQRWKFSPDDSDGIQSQRDCAALHHDD